MADWIPDNSSDWIPDEGQKPLKKKSTRNEILQPEIEKMSGTQKFLTGVGGGMYDVFKGVQQAGATLGNKLGLVKPETVKRITDEGMETRDLMKPLYDQSTAAKVGQFVGQAAPMAVIPGGVGGNALRRVGTSALAGAGMGAAQFVPEGESRGANALTGAAFGAAGSAAVSGAGKAYNAIAKKVPTNTVQRLADKFNIPITLGESTRNTPLQKTEVLLERAPGALGLSGFRKKQSEAAHTAAKELIGKYIADPTAGDIEAGNRAFAGKIFEEVKGLVSQVPNQEINPSETRSIASDIVSRLDRLKDARTQSLVESVLDRVSAKPPKLTQNPRGMSGEMTGMGIPPEPPPMSSSQLYTGVKDKPIPPIVNFVEGRGGKSVLGAPVDFATGKSIPKTLTFDQMWTLRQDLGDKMGQARMLMVRGEIDKTAYSQIKQLFGAVSKDLDEWSSTIKKPEIMERFKAANSAYKNYVVKYDILQRAYDKADGTVGAGEMFSPKKFSTSLKAIVYKDKALKNFTPLEQQEMTGLANIMQVVKRAGQYAENPPTGNRWGAITAGGMLEAAAYKAGGIAGAVKTAGAGAVTAGVLRFLTSTEQGKRLALAASKVEPTSPSMGKILNQIMNQAPKLTAAAGLNAIQKQPQELTDEPQADNP